MAGLGLAAAQDTKDNRQAPAPAAQDENAPAGKMDQPPGSLPQKSPPAPTAQAPTKEKPAVTARRQLFPSPRPRNREVLRKFGIAGRSHRPERGKRRDEVRRAGCVVERTACENPGLAAGRQGRALSNVQFSITVAGLFPETVHLYYFARSVVEYAPQYRDYEYILVGDEILSSIPAR